MAKSQKPRAKKQVLLSELEKIEQEILRAEEEDKALIERVQNSITELENNNNVFIGVVLFPKDIGVIVEQLANGGGYVKIPTQIFHKETEE